MKNTGHLLSSFTFGFELEGWTQNTGKFRELKKYTEATFNKETPFVKFIGTRPDSFHGDGSINPSCDSHNVFGRSSSGRSSCPECDGDGYVIEGTCTCCGGTGHVTTDDGERETCDECDGSGEIRRTCPECDGDGLVSGGEYTFEWSSPVFNVVPKNVVDVIRYLKYVSKNFVYTNSSCGFHIHIGFPEKVKLGPQMLWLLTKLASDEGQEQYKAIINYNETDLFNERYATTKVVTDIRALKDRVRNEKEFMSLLIERAYSDDKYVMLRIHPQGTLEWRGPRGFLDNKDPQVIQGFFIYKFVPFVKWMADALVSETATFGDMVILRKELFEVLADNKRRTSPVESDHSSKVITRNSNRFNWGAQDVAILPKVFKLFPWLKKAKFENAVVTLGSRDNLLWKQGKWLDGEWVRGTFYNGSFNGVWRTGVFRGGQFSGTWCKGEMLGGEFLNGEFLGGKASHVNWKNGIFRYGLMENSSFSNGVFEGGTFNGGTFHSGEFKGGKFLSGDFRSGKIHRDAQFADSITPRVWIDAATEKTFHAVKPSTVYAMTEAQFEEYFAKPVMKPDSNGKWVMYTVTEEEAKMITDQMRNISSDELEMKLAELISSIQDVQQAEAEV